MSKLQTCVAATAAVLVFAAMPAAVFAEVKDNAQDAEVQRLEAILRSQHPLSGDVRVPGAEATLHLGKTYYFLRADEAKQVLKEWGNPPADVEGVLGMVFPAGKTFLDETWGGVVTYEQAGYISDHDADKIDYQKLLDEVHQGEDAANEERKKAGFASAHLVGWAQPPSYDTARHYLIWARDIRYEGESPDTLNYSMRILGRRGYLNINLVSEMPKLQEIRAEAAQLASAATFDPGSTYADYQPDTDHKAEYGVAGLVAAGLGLAAAKKIGLLALIAVFAKKFVVLIAAAFAGLLTRFRRLFKKDPSARA